MGLEPGIAILGMRSTLDYRLFCLPLGKAAFPCGDSPVYTGRWEPRTLGRWKRCLVLVELPFDALQSHRNSTPERLGWEQTLEARCSTESLCHSNEYFYRIAPAQLEAFVGAQGNTAFCSKLRL